MQPAICLLSVVPMRKEPSHRSEMVSQLLFGEYVQGGEERDDFVFVKCMYDGYEGWVQRKQLTMVDQSEIFTTTEYTCSFVSDVQKNDFPVRAPFGTPVYNLEKYSLSIRSNTIKYLISPQQLWNSAEWALTPQNLFTVYQYFINTPYLWGGKSVFGIDCSGFVQQVFKMFGIKLLRDAYLQASQGEAVNSLGEAVCCDLAFFCNEGGRVTHVGIILEEGKIVHASGQVRIDSIDEEGIWNEAGEKTHTMHSIRRVS